MPLIEILSKSFGWMSGVGRLFRRRNAGPAHRHRLDLGSIPARIEAKELSITIGKQVEIVESSSEATMTGSSKKRRREGARRRRR